MVNDFGGRVTTKMVVGPTTILGAAHYDYEGRYYDYEGRYHDHEAGRVADFLRSV